MALASVRRDELSNIDTKATSASRMPTQMSRLFIQGLPCGSLSSFMLLRPFVALKIGARRLMAMQRRRLHHLFQPKRRGRAGENSQIAPARARIAPIVAEWPEPS